MIPRPIVREHDGVLVVRDDLLAGGSKQRVAEKLLRARAAAEYVYASPAQGYAQIALAQAAADAGVRATVFVAKRNAPHERTLRARQAGAKVVQVSPGHLVVVQARAREYARRVGAALLPFGFDNDEAHDALVTAARWTGLAPREVWCAAGSGTLARALGDAWPLAAIHAVRVGRPPEVGRATLHVAPERYEQDAAEPPPFPSCGNYDAKVWRFVRSRPGALFWNVAA